jgi:hypothetical protein
MILDFLLDLGESIIGWDYLGEAWVQIRLTTTINFKLVPTTHKLVPNMKPIT